MSKFIELRKKQYPTSERILINTDWIVSISEFENGSCIELGIASDNSPNSLKTIFVQEAYDIILDELEPDCY